MLTLYHAPTTRSLRVKWLLAELDLPYQEHVLDFYSNDRVDPAYLKINPMASVPTMTDGGITLTESGAIIEYLVAKHGGGRFSPLPGSAEDAMVKEWMYWSEGLFAVHQRIFWDHCAPPPGCILNPIPAVGEEAKRQAIRYAGMLDAALRDDGFSVGNDLTGADFMLSFPLFLANIQGWFETLPAIKAYVNRIMQRPAFQFAIKDTIQCLESMHTAPPKVKSFRSVETGVFNMSYI